GRWWWTVRRSWVSLLPPIGSRRRLLAWLDWPILERLPGRDRRGPAKADRGQGVRLLQGDARQGRRRDDRPDRLHSPAVPMARRPAGGAGLAGGSEPGPDQGRLNADEAEGRQGQDDQEESMSLTGEERP